MRRIPIALHLILAKQDGYLKMINAKFSALFCVLVYFISLKSGVLIPNSIQGRVSDAEISPSSNICFPVMEWSERRKRKKEVA